MVNRPFGAPLGASGFDSPEPHIRLQCLETKYASRFKSSTISFRFVILLSAMSRDDGDRGDPLLRFPESAAPETGRRWLSSSDSA
jgi:hypothetical protein